jgi:tripartite-type tricarboxylate transporter receptor subunit TctC
MRRRAFFAVIAAVPIVTELAWSQTYPTRPVRMIVPLAAGGPTDVFARLIAQRLTDATGKQFYVENIPGARGNIGIGRAAHAAADGYTILVVASSYVVNPSLYLSIPYDPVKDFDPITIAVTNVVALSVNPSVTAHTVDELITLIKSNPGKYGYASAGAGQASHLLGETFADRFVITINLSADGSNSGASVLHFDKPLAVGPDDPNPPNEVDTAPQELVPFITSKKEDGDDGQPL